MIMYYLFGVADIDYIMPGAYHPEMVINKRTVVCSKHAGSVQAIFQDRDSQM